MDILFPPLNILGQVRSGETNNFQSAQPLTSDGSAVKPSANRLLLPNMALRGLAASWLSARFGAISSGSAVQNLLPAARR